jgi:hypothetical protein
MRFGWALLAAIMPIAVACSSGGDNLKPLPLAGFLQTTGGECDALAQVEASYDPSASTGTAEVYAAEAAQIDAGYAEKIADKLGISGKVSDEGSAYSVEDDNASVDIEKRGNYVMYRKKEFPSDTAGEGEAPSDGEAKHIAEQFLRGLDLSVPGDWAKAEYLRDEFGVDVVWRPSAFREIEIAIPGLMLDVLVGNQGVVEGMHYYWQNLRPTGEYPLVSEADALKRLRDCKGRWFSVRNGQVVNDAKIEYIGYPIDGPYQYFVPVYHFSDRTFDSSGDNLDTYATPEAGTDRVDRWMQMIDVWVVAIDDRYIEAPPS